MSFNILGLHISITVTREAQEAVDWYPGAEKHTVDRILEDHRHNVIKYGFMR